MQNFDTFDNEMIEKIMRSELTLKILLISE